MKIIGYLFVFLMVAFFGWLLWVFIHNIQNADPSIKAGLIGILGVLVGGIFTHYQTKKREINARHFDDKRKGYMYMIDLLFELIISTIKKKELSEEMMFEKIMPFKKALIVWGSPEVIEAWNHFEMKSENGLSPEEMILEMEKILRAIRKDLGHDDSALNFGSLWGLMLVAEDKKMALGEKK